MRAAFRLSREALSLAGSGPLYHPHAPFGESPPKGRGGAGDHEPVVPLLGHIPDTQDFTKPTHPAPARWPFVRDDGRGGGGGATPTVVSCSKIKPPTPSPRGQLELLPRLLPRAVDPSRRFGFFPKGPCQRRVTGYLAAARDDIQNSDGHGGGQRAWGSPPVARSPRACKPTADPPIPCAMRRWVECCMSISLSASLLFSRLGTLGVKRD